MLALDLDEFVKQNTPAARSWSKLAPYLGDMRRLRGMGYSHKQIQSYLATKGIEVSIPGISSYLKRHHDDANVTSRSNINQPEPCSGLSKTASGEITAHAIPTSHNVVDIEADDTQTYFKPDDLKNILNTPIDLDKLAKQGKRHHKQKRKPDYESGSD